MTDVMQDSSSNADALHDMASNLATTIASIKEPLADGVDVLVAQMILTANKVRDENIALEERLRAAEKEREDVQSDLLLCQNKLVSFQETLTAALAATSDTELQLDAKNTELEQLRKENRLATRDRDDAERRLAVELASWDKTKAEWATKEAHYKEAVKSHAKVNKELKTETVLKEEILSGAFEEQQSVVLETAKSAMREKDSVIAKLHETLIKLESGNADVSTRLSIAYDEITSLRNEIEELRVQNRSLIEDNELYQVLLRERTLNGEFKTKSVVMGGAYFDDDLPPPRASLSDELDGTSQASKSSKSQLSELEEQVKALKLFIDVILKKILEDDDFEAKVISNRNTPTSSPASATQSSRRWPFTDSPASLSVTPPSPHRSASPNRTRSGLRTASPSVARNASPLRTNPLTPPRTPKLGADGKPRRPALTVSTVGVDGGVAGPMSAPAVRNNPVHPKSGLALEAAVTAASNASVTNFPRRASSITAENEAAMAAAAAAASASVSNLPTVDDEDEEPYEAPPPRVVVDGPTDGSGSSGFFGGFVRRISNAFASLTSPLPVEEGVNKELPSPVVEEGAEVPEPIETLAKINVDITGVPPPPPADATAPPPPPKADDIATAPAAEAK